MMGIFAILAGAFVATVVVLSLPHEENRMDVNGKLSLDEAKRVAILGPNANLGDVKEALDTLYTEVRRLEDIIRDLPSVHKR